MPVLGYLTIQKIYGNMPIGFGYIILGFVIVWVENS